MTPEDAEQITAIVAAAEQRITTTLATTLTGTVAASEQRTAQAIAAAKDQTVEALRDMQTEMLLSLIHI